MGRAAPPGSLPSSVGRSPREPGGIPDGPCPPGGTHRYFIAAYALDARLGWEAGADKTSVLEAIHDHVLAEASLLGFYSRE